MSDWLRWLRSLFCRHELYFVRTLITLAEVRCCRCEGHWLSKEHEGAIWWPAEATSFFDRHQEARDGE